MSIDETDKRSSFIYQIFIVSILSFKQSVKYLEHVNEWSIIPTLADSSLMGNGDLQIFNIMH